MKKITIWIIIGLILIVGAVIVFSGKDNESGGSMDQPTKGDFGFNLASFSGLEFEDYQGNKVRLSDFSGTPLVINSWAAWCPFCRKELPDFVTVQKEFPDQVLFIAIDRSESLAVAKKYSDEIGVTDDLVFWLDSKDAFYQSIGGFSMPETIFVDADGKVQFHKRGPMDVDEIRQRVETLLNN